jgi:hypothetical protein
VNENQVYIKTSMGSAELQSRARRLPSRMRTMLIMVDGVQTLGQLQAAANVLGAPEACMQFLIEQGLIEAKPRAAPRASSVAGATQAAHATLATPTLTAAGQPAPEAEPEAPLSDAARYLAAQKLMNDSVVDALGFRAFFFTLKLERSFNCEDLRTTLPDFNKALSKGKDQAAAALIEARVRVLLSNQSLRP